MTKYSPFKNAMSDLKAADLESLRSVPESWHVEYKRNIESPTDLAKAISAFANTHGGWLFVGVSEDIGPESTAQEFPGLRDDELSVLLQRLSSSMSDHISPPPHYEVKVLPGPCTTIDLPEGQSIVVIYVPKSIRTPHIHQNGRIYCRIGDTSQPTHLSDRHHLEELLSRGDGRREMVKLWVDADPEFSKGESGIPYVRLMLTPDPWKEEKLLPVQSIERWREVIHSPEFSPVSITFDSMYPTHNGFIARHIHDQNPLTLGLTFAVYDDLSCDITMPIAMISGTAPDLVVQLSQRYEYAEQFVAMLESQGYWRDDEWFHLEIMDLNSLLYVLIAVINQYNAILKQTEAPSLFHFKARILHAWRRVPFFDVPEIISDFSELGVPMMMYEEITLPPGSDPDSFVPLQFNGEHAVDSKELSNDYVSAGIEIFDYLLSAFGIPGLTNMTRSPSGNVARSLLNAAQRSVNFNYREL